MLTLGEHARRSLLIALVGCGVVAALVLMAMIALPFVIPAEDLRRAASQAITGTTGQRVKMSGDPVLRMFPSPRLSLGKVEFPLPRGQSLDAESVDARLDLWPLVFGQVEVADVTLLRPTLVLTGARVVPAAVIAPFLAEKDLPELRIADGTVAWRDETGLTQELVSGIVGSLDRILDGKGIAVVVDFDWRDVPVSAKLLMDDGPAFMAGSQTPMRLSIRTDTSRAFFGGTAALGSSFSATGEVSARTTSLRDVVAWLGGSAPTSGGLAGFDLSARLKVEDGAADLTETQIDLDGNRSDGALLVKLSGPRPLVQGTFASDSLNLSPYGRMRFTGSNGRDWDRRSIDVSFLKDFDVDLRLSAGEVTMEGSRFRTVATSAVLTDGRLALTLGQARAWGGMLRASAILSPRPAASGMARPGAVVRIEAEGTDVALDTALDDMAGIRRLEGTGDLTLILEGEGRSIQDIAQHLSGSIALTGKDGSLIGFDVAQVLHRVERRPLSGGDPRGGRTAFTNLDTKIAITDGLADIEQMSLEGKRVRLTLAGTAAVGVRDLDLKGTAALVGKPDDSGDAPMELPFIVQGAWDSPLVIADPQSLLQRSGAAQPLLEAVRKRAGAGAVQKVIESLTQASGTVATGTLPAAAAATPPPPGN